MSRAAERAFSLVHRFRKCGIAQVAGYHRFGFVGDHERGVFVSRERGKDTLIPFAKIVQAVEAVRSEPGVYDEGPTGLRRHGVAHINSPLWAILHLMDIEKLRS